MSYADAATIDHNVKCRAVDLVKVVAPVRKDRSFGAGAACRRRKLHQSSALSTRNYSYAYAHHLIMAQGVESEGLLGSLRAALDSLDSSNLTDCLDRIHSLLDQCQSHKVDVQPLVDHKSVAPALARACTSIMQQGAQKGEHAIRDRYMAVLYASQILKAVIDTTAAAAAAGTSSSGGGGISAEHASNKLQAKHQGGKAVEQLIQLRIPERMLTAVLVLLDNGGNDSEQTGAGSELPALQVGIIFAPICLSSNLTHPIETGQGHCSLLDHGLNAHTITTRPNSMNTPISIRNYDAMRTNTTAYLSRRPIWSLKPYENFRTLNI